MTLDAPLRPPRRGRLCPSLLALVCVLALPAISNAQAPVCSNGIIESGEACDDGNLLNGDGCTAACVIEQDCYDPDNTFSFFIWSDSYTSAGESGVKRVLDDAVNQTRYPNRIIPRFWLSTGDIPYMETALDKLDRLNDRISNWGSSLRYPFSCSASNGRFPYFVALGNHDVDGYLDTTPESQYVYWSTQVGPTVNSTLVGISNFQQGPTSPDGHDALTNYSFDYKNTHFVIVNQYFEDSAYPTATPAACMRQSLLDWIDQDLAASTRPVKFVAGHEPAWSYCNNAPGSGGSYCQPDNPDYIPVQYRPRPWSPNGDWNQPYGKHWRGSLEDAGCPEGSREAFWQLLANRGAVAHFNGHTHTYSGRLVQGDGTRRNDVPPYSKTGQTFSTSEGVWEVDSAQVHTSSGAAYVLVTVRDNLVTFEAWDQEGTTEPFALVETWNVAVAGNSAPTLNAIGDQSGAEGTAIAFTASASDGDLPPNSLAYSLVTAPAGASIDPATGVFSWTPAEAEGPGSYGVTVRVTDNGAPPASDEENLTITVSESNAAPELAPIGDKSFDEHTSISFTAAASDSDVPANGLTFSLVAGPGGAAIDPGTGGFSWTPGEGQGLGTYPATIRVTDDGSPAAFDEETITITIDNVNDAPVLAPIGNRSGPEQEAIAFTASATDGDLPANVLTFSLVTAPAGATIDPATGAFSWTPSENDGPGTYAATVRVTDDFTPGAWDEESITLTVDEANASPVLEPIADVAVAELAPITFTASAGDSDLPANTLTFSLTSAPAGASIDPSTGAFTWTPTEAQGPGSPSVTVRVTDNGAPAAFAERSVTITVSEANQAPVLAPIGNRSGPEQAAIAFTASATDGDLPANALTFSLVSAPSGATINPATGAFSWTPAEGDGPGTYAATIRVADGAPGAWDEETITLTVDEANASPVLAPIADAAGPELAPIVFTASASDSDLPANTLTFSLTSAPAGASINPSTGAFSWTPAEAQGPGSYAVTVRVTDNGAPVRFAERGLTVTVSEANQAPVLAPIGNRSVAVQNLLTFTASATDADLPAQALGYGLQGAPAGAAIDAATGVFTWTPTGAQVGVYAFSVTVADDQSPAGTAQQPVSVTVTGGPDLVMSVVSTGTTVIAPGSTLSLSNTVLNQGSSGSGGFTIAFHLSVDAQYGGADDVAFSQTRTPGGLSAGASNAASTSLTVPASTPLGVYYVCALADSAGVVSETAETNNGRCTAGTINVTRPDLVMTALTPNSATVRRGRNLSVTDTVRNQGLLAAAASQVSYRLSVNAVYGDADDVVISTIRPVSALNGGAQETNTRNIAIPDNAPLGFYRVCGKADGQGAGAVTESNENNNTFCTAGTVQVRN